MKVELEKWKAEAEEGHAGPVELCVSQFGPLMRVDQLRIIALCGEVERLKADTKDIYNQRDDLEQEILDLQDKLDLSSGAAERVKELEAALRKVSAHLEEGTYGSIEDAEDIAKKALEGGGEGGKE